MIAPRIDAGIRHSHIPRAFWNGKNRDIAIIARVYHDKTAVKFNIPEAEAVDRLQDLIREHGKWVEPAPQTALEPASASSR
jgi:S1-C subfamily serine protease